MEKHICKTNKQVEKFPENETFQQLGELYKIFGDPTRLKIMYLLLKQSMNVCDIAIATQMSHSAISHQLSLLKKVNLVKYEKKGKQVIYALADYHVAILIATGMEHINE